MRGIFTIENFARESRFSIRLFVWRHFITITVIWLLVVGVACAQAVTTCSRSLEDGHRPLFGAITWFFPNFGAEP